MDGFATVTEAAAGRRFAAEVAHGGPGNADRLWARVSPPPPDTVVVTSAGHTVALLEQAWAREAALRTEAAAEVARLTRALRDQRKAHAAEIARLRAEHAAGVRRLVEAHWRGQDAARNGAECPSGPEEGAAPGPRARPPFLPPPTREWLARLTGRG